MAHALVVDDNVDSAGLLGELIAREHFTVAIAHNLRDARRQVSLQQPDIVLLESRLPDGSGIDLLSDRHLMAHSEVVLCTAHASVETSVEAFRMGAADYLVKPINLKQLQGVLSRLMKPAVLTAEVANPAASRPRSGQFGQLWGRSEAMQGIYEQITRVAGTDITVFITGESGTGKELVAETVHDLSGRSKRPFLAVNCGAISPNLIESELFGHEKGSFTGAERQHQGFFERANGGTLFLDEITEMPTDLQVKLLRVLETGRFMRVGSTVNQKADVRIIAATNRLPHEAVSTGRLREDLLYRLNVFPIDLPPLRDRLSDVASLAEHFLAGMRHQEGPTRRFSPEALNQLATHHWPGNVRELRNVVQRAYVMASDETIDETWLPRVAAASGSLSAAPVPRTLRPAVDPLAAARVPGSDPDPVTAPAAVHPAGGAVAAVMLAVGTSMAAAERMLLLATLRNYNHHKERTAAVLGISLKTLYNRLKEYAAEDALDAPRD